MRQLPVLALLSLSLLTPPANSSELQIDGWRSYAQFSVRLLWLHAISGRFTHVDGHVSVDAEGNAVVQARIAADSVTMSSERLRQWSVGSEFFDARTYPTIMFESVPTPLARLSAGGVMDGRLSLRGVTRPVRFDLLPVQCDPRLADPCEIEARGSIERSQFGMGSHRVALSDRVQLSMTIALRPAPD